MHSLIILCGYVLDLILGDPTWQWHPTRIIGHLIEILERRLNTGLPPHLYRCGFLQRCGGKLNKIFAGILLVILVVGTIVFCVWSILKLAKLIHPYLYYLISILFIYSAVSVKQLGIEANKVLLALRARDLAQARKFLSMIVARDTHKLDEPEIIRATVETVAESTMDGIIAPLFYAFLGGPVLAWAYKAINTLDSMVGHRSERFIDFGKASAKLDALVNFIPAKITMIIISLSAWHYRKDSLNSIRWVLRYFLKGPADNSEATEAVVAGVLGVQLGGLNFYQTLPIQKPFIGDNFYPLNTRHIQESVNLVYISSVLFMVVGIVLLLIISPSQNSFRAVDYTDSRQDYTDLPTRN